MNNQSMNTHERLYALRGATCCENTPQDIEQQVLLLYDSLLCRNNLEENQIVSVQFTVTPDLTTVNPAAALRKAGRAQELALFAAAEPVIEGMLP
ncbi:MAG: chorismate mutase, partial [Termitinemataceae bacterium]